LSPADASYQASQLSLAVIFELLARVATDQRRGCYAKILSTLRAADISNTLNEASPCATAADARAVAVAADRACTVRRAVFTVARAAARFKRLLAKVRTATMTVCVKSLDGRSLDVTLPMMSSIMTLREAVAREAELALSTVELFVTGGDGEALRDNLRLMKAVGRHVAPSTATAFMVVKTDACWTCAICCCANARALTACTNCRMQRPSTELLTEALRKAAENGDAAAASALIAAAVPLDKCSTRGDTALTHASTNGHLEVVQALLAAGAGTTSQSRDGFTALTCASDNGHLQVVQALLAAGADTAAKSQKGALPLGQTALTRASGKGHLEVVQALLAAGADTAAHNQHGHTALIEASGQGHLGVVQALLAAGAGTAGQSETGFTALICASGKGHLEVVQALLVAGADTAARNQRGDTARACASRGGHTAVTSLLMGDAL
jgi:ankyrin repeat protein